MYLMLVSHDYCLFLNHSAPPPVSPPPGLLSMDSRNESYPSNPLFHERLLAPDRQRWKENVWYKEQLLVLDRKRWRESLWYREQLLVLDRQGGGGTFT